MDWGEEKKVQEAEERKQDGQREVFSMPQPRPFPSFPSPKLCSDQSHVPADTVRTQHQSTFCLLRPTPLDPAVTTSARERGDRASGAVCSQVAVRSRPARPPGG